jgi:aldehyde:ferredoxin oxidoreductase
MRAFCVREGNTREADSLPKRLMEDPLPDGPGELENPPQKNWLNSAWKI